MIDFEKEIEERIWARTTVFVHGSVDNVIIDQVRELIKPDLAPLDVVMYHHTVEDK